MTWSCFVSNFGYLSTSTDQTKVVIVEIICTRNNNVIKAISFIVSDRHVGYLRN